MSFNEFIFCAKPISSSDVLQLKLLALATMNFEPHAFSFWLVRLPKWNILRLIRLVRSKKIADRCYMYVHMRPPPPNFFFPCMWLLHICSHCRSVVWYNFYRDPSFAQHVCSCLSLTDEEIEFLRASGYSTETRSLTFSSLEGLCGWSKQMNCDRWSRKKKKSS